MQPYEDDGSQRACRVLNAGSKLSIAPPFRIGSCKSIFDITERAQHGLPPVPIGLFTLLAPLAHHGAATADTRPISSGPKNDVTLPVSANSPKHCVIRSFGASRISMVRDAACNGPAAMPIRKPSAR